MSCDRYTLEYTWEMPIFIQSGTHIYLFTQTRHGPRGRIDIKEENLVSQQHRAWSERMDVQADCSILVAKAKYFWFQHER